MYVSIILILCRQESHLLGLFHSLLQHGLYLRLCRCEFCAAIRSDRDTCHWQLGERRHQHRGRQLQQGGSELLHGLLLHLPGRYVLLLPSTQATMQKKVIERDDHHGHHCHPHRGFGRLSLR